jgi:hypothetical protein
MSGYELRRLRRDTVCRGRRGYSALTMDLEELSLVLVGLCGSHIYVVINNESMAQVPSCVFTHVACFFTVSASPPRRR